MGVTPLMTYKINEYFYSIQGEGLYTGIPMVFVRFAQCNMNCAFCDTVHVPYWEKTEEQIVEEIKKYNCSAVCFTGGEPLLQLKNDVEKGSYVDLMGMLLNEGIKDFYLETNGSIELPEYATQFFNITVSPKKKDFKIRKGEVLKIVYGVFQDSDLENIKNTTEFEHYFIQPMYNYNEKEALAFVLNHPEWRYSCQCHKYLNIK